MTIQVRNGRVDIDVPSDDNARQCARLLKDHPSPIKSLRLRKGVMTSAGASAIAKALKGNKTLKQLALRGNDIGDAGAGFIGMAVEGNLGCALTTLDLAAIGMTVMGLSNLVQGISQLPGLHTLCLSDNNLAQEAGYQLSTLFKSSSSLHTLMVDGNYLGDRGISALCGAFCYLNPARVISLDVSGNGIGNLGVEWLSKGISKLCHTQIQSNNSSESGSAWGGIRVLRARGNNITHLGATQLAKLFSEEKCARELVELDLSMNTITADGFRPLAESLRACRELVHVDVSNCRLGPGGLEAAAELIAGAGPKLSAVILTPKPEFADRVQDDRSGLAVALRRSLQRLADSLRFAGSVVELNLGSFVRADPASAASIQETLHEHRERLGISSSSSPSPSSRPGAEAAAGRSVEKKGGKHEGTRSTAPRSGEKIRGSGAVKAGAQVPSATPSRYQSRSAVIGGAPSPGSRGGTPRTQRSGAATGRENSARGGGIERPKTGSEKSKPAAKGRTKRLAAAGAGMNGRAPSGSTSSSTPPAPSSSVPRSASKPSSRVARGGSGGTVASSSGRSARQGAAPPRGTGATSAMLAAHDKAAAAATPRSHRRMHQGEELDSIDGFSVLPQGAAAPNSRSLPRESDVVMRSADSSAAGSKGGASVEKIADLVSKVMGDTEGIAHGEPPPAVAPSSWKGRDDEVVNGRSRRVAESSSLPAAAVADRRDKDLDKGNKDLVRKPSASAKGNDGESLSSTEERRLRLNSRSQESAIDLSNVSNGEQLITLAEAGRMLGPWMAREVEKEARKIEIRLQNEMNKTLALMRSDMEAIDREALMARVAMEKRIKTSLKRLVDRFEHIERRFARLERADERRAALEAGGSATPIENGGASRRALLLSELGSDSDEQHRRELQMSVVRAATRGKLGEGGEFSDASRLAYSAGDALLSSITTESCTVASEEDFRDSGDESEIEIVRMLSEKMSALEGKLLVHEKRGEADKCTADGMVTPGVDDGLGKGSAVRT